MKIRFTFARFVMALMVATLSTFIPAAFIYNGWNNYLFVWFVPFLVFWAFIVALERRK